MSCRRLFNRILSSKRSFSSGHSHGPSVIHEGVSVPIPKSRLVNEAKMWGALCWFWVFYQFSENGDVLLGFRNPWEHRGHAIKLEDNELPDGTSLDKSHHH